MTISELEAYFHGIDLPKTIKLDAATTINNMDTFLTTNIMRAKNWMGEPERNPSLWLLRRLREVLERESQI